MREPVTTISSSGAAASAASRAGAAALAPAAVDEQHVKRYVGVLHPHADDARLSLWEQHAFVCRQPRLEHQSQLLPGNVIGDADVEHLPAMRGADLERRAREVLVGCDGG